MKTFGPWMSVLVGLAALAPAAHGAEPEALAQHESLRGEQDVDLDALDSAAEATWTPVVENEFSVPNGYSYSPVYAFTSGPAQVDAVKAELLARRGTQCGASVYALDVAHTADQILATRYFPNAAGEFLLPNTTIYKLSVTVFQPRLVAGLCTLRVSVKLHGSDQPQPDPSGFQLAGVARYEGGFRHRIAVDVGGERVVRFWARVPAHCQGLELLEAGTVSEGHYDAARLVDAERRIFEVNGGSGARASAINLSFNGPAGLVCDVPVYVQH